MQEGIDSTKLGSLETLEEGRKLVRFRRLFDLPIGQLWHAITDPDHLAHWFPGLQFEPKEGGKFEIWFSDTCDGPAHAKGVVACYQPPKRLEIGTMCYQLEATSSGCSLTFTDILNFDSPLSEAEVINSVLGGWHKYLDSLEYSLVGGALDPRSAPEPDYAKVTIPGRPD